MAAGFTGIAPGLTEATSLYARASQCKANGTGAARSLQQSGGCAGSMGRSRDSQVSRFALVENAESPADQANVAVKAAFIVRAHHARHHGAVFCDGVFAQRQNMA